MTTASNFKCAGRKPMLVIVVVIAHNRRLCVVNYTSIHAELKILGGKRSGRKKYEY